MSDIAIKVENISKRYRIGLKEELHDTFIGALTSWVKFPIRNFKQLRKLSHFDDNPGKKPDPMPSAPSSMPSSQSDDVIWALRDISFEVKHGEVLGIIGRNGAGKSTLLKVLCRIVEPTSGNAFLNGRVASLLEVGTGFHPELTGRENVYLNGTLLGMKKTEVDRKFDEIVDFSGVEKFIDTPVKRYSSGMRVRLAFAVAAHLEPEILLIDEVLAVGDSEFQKKSIGKMKEVSQQGRTVLFVSHNMVSISSLTQKSILLNEGKIVKYASTSETIKTYNNYLIGSGIKKQLTTLNSNLIINSIKIDNQTLTKPFKLIGIDINLTCKIDWEQFSFGLQVINSFNTKLGTSVIEIGKMTSGNKKIRVEIYDHQLPPGSYRLNIGINGNKEHLFWQTDLLSFEILSTGLSINNVNSYINDKRDLLGVWFKGRYKIE